jgi:Rrf2 family iron-sulfur cluster assembly transcriptional regulator
MDLLFERVQAPASAYSEDLVSAVLRRESQYALEGLLVLARQPVGRVMLLKHVAQQAGISPAFLARIFQRLKRHNLVTSSRGAIRGYSLARRADAITLLDIFQAIEGPTVFRRCIFSPHRAMEPHCCRLQRQWAPIAARLCAVMKETTLGHVASHGLTGHSRRTARHAHE